MELYKKIETKNPKIEIEIVYDTVPLDPREDYDNLATLLCAHRDYNLGDMELSHDCDSIQEALYEWVYLNYRDCMEFHEGYIQGRITADMMEAIENGELDPDCELDKEAWEENWLTLHNEPDIYFLYDTWAIQKWIDNNLYVSNLYLYDHSGITISTGPFSCRWDSGQVGFALIHKDTIKENWKDCEDWRKKAEGLVEGEVKEYDDYLTGNCFGFRVLKDDEEVDSCWGYLGNPEDSGVIEDAKRSADYTIEQLAKEDAEVRYWACRDVVTEI